MIPCSSWRSLRPTAQQSQSRQLGFSERPCWPDLRRLRRRTQPRRLGSCYMGETTWPRN